MFKQRRCCVTCRTKAAAVDCMHRYSRLRWIGLFLAHQAATSCFDLLDPRHQTTAPGPKVVDQRP
eukprot:6192328-Pleurochrysis_carterae.AAC.4